jgi:hypothetical protein
MRAIFYVTLVGVALEWAAFPAQAGGNDNRTAEMDAAARAFLKAYKAKDLDALMAIADAPFLVGAIGDPRSLANKSAVQADLKSRLAAVGKFPARVAKTLTWDQAISPAAGADEARKMRQQLKSVIAATGEDGGYAALADDAGGGRGRRLLAVSDTRLLLGIRDGKAKVVGIVVDGSGKH